MNDEELNLIKNLNDPNEYDKFQRKANAMEAISKLLNTVLITDEQEKNAFQR